MRFEPLDLPDARLIRLDPQADARGSFTRVWCADSFARAGIGFTPVQANCSVTYGRGTLRGMHFQRFPRPDPKLVRVAAGRIYDVIVDLRPDSPGFGRWQGLYLDAEDQAALYVPPGFAHGFQLMAGHAVVEYMMGEVYVPELYAGFRWDDPLLGIAWPLPPERVSERDRSWPPLARQLDRPPASGPDAG